MKFFTRWEANDPAKRSYQSVGSVKGVTKWMYIMPSIALAVLILFGMSFRVVGVGKVGIVTQFGNVLAERQSGAFFKAPWQNFTTMNIQIQKEQQDASAATKDLQTVNTVLALNYHLTSDTAGTVFRSIGTDYKLRIIDPVLQEAVKATTSQYNADELISQRPQVETAIETELSAKLTKRGITVDNVSIVNFQFSTQFSKAIEDKQVAAQQAAQAAYNVQKEENNARAGIAAAEGQAKSQELIASTVIPEVLQQQAIAKWDGKLPTYLGSGTVFNIPLQGN